MKKIRKWLRRHDQPVGFSYQLNTLSNLPKKLFTAILVFTLLLTFVPTTMLANPSEIIPVIVTIESTATVTINGQEVVFPDHGAVIVDGRTYVPVHGIFEQMGFNVTMRPDAEDILIIGNDAQAIVNLSLSFAWISHYRNLFYYHPYVLVEPVILIVMAAAGELDIEEYLLEPPILEIDGQIMLPLRALVEAIGGTVQWDNENNVVMVQNKKML
ncbi:MAG: copper amine oxidase N-terminal domain-containing protein [Defluviitaleaceae bacterium]|nr:copper amine oxidase N-terminal domain-containing protein [Defluviitaleaceae bacterium]